MSSLNVQSISNIQSISDGINSIAVDKLIKGTAVAWADVDSSGNVRRGLNVSGVADGISPAVYTVTFSTPMESSNYVIVGSSTASTIGTDAVSAWFSVVSRTSTGFVYQIRTTISGGLPGTGKNDECFFACFE